MVLAGDHRALGLPDLLQSLEAGRKTGTLQVTPENGGPAWTLAIDAAAIQAVARAGGEMPCPAEAMVRWGWVQEGLAGEAIRRWHKARRKTLGQILLDLGALEREAYRALLGRIVEEEVLSCLAQEKVHFAFAEGDPRWEEFDPEQLWAEIRLPLGPLLLEAARRSDEWVRIRRNVGSDRDVFLPLPVDAPPPEEPVQAAVLASLDGVSDLQDLLARLPHTRFELAKALSDLVEQGRIRQAGPEELCRLAEADLEGGQEDRAMDRLRAALEVHRHDAGLRLRLAEVLAERGEAQEAASELALAGQDLEAEGDEEGALVALARAVELRPAEPALRGRLLLFHLKLGSLEEARRHGLELVRLYLSLGLADKARKVLYRLLREGPLQEDEGIFLALVEVELAAGRPQEAGGLLLRLAGRSRQAGREGRALELYERVRRLLPGVTEAERAVAEIRSGAYRRRRGRRRRLLRIAALTLASATAFLWALHEGAARADLERLVVQALEETALGAPAAAVPAAFRLAAGHPFTLAAGEAEELARQLAELQLERARGLLAQGRLGGAALALVGLKEQAGGLVPRSAWWGLLAPMLDRAVFRGLPEREQRLLLWSLRRLTGVARKDLAAWRSWWERSGVHFVEPVSPPPERLAAPLR